MGMDNQPTEDSHLFRHAVCKPVLSVRRAMPHRRDRSARAQDYKTVRSVIQSNGSSAAPHKRTKTLSESHEVSASKGKAIHSVRLGAPGLLDGSSENLENSEGGSVVLRASMGEAPLKSVRPSKDLSSTEKPSAEDCARFSMEEEITVEKDRPGSNLAFYSARRKVGGAKMQIKIVSR